jgi:hypothetical protein
MQNSDFVYQVSIFVFIFYMLIKQVRAEVATWCTAWIKRVDGWCFIAVPSTPVVFLAFTLVLSRLVLMNHTLGPRPMC